MIIATTRQWLSLGSRPVWATGLLVALLAWPLGIIVPTTGLDYSWMSGLYMAVHEGKLFGSEIVFTYGPLGFLAWPEYWFSWLSVLAYLYVSAIYLAFAVTLTWTLKRTVGLLGAAVIAFLFLVTIPDLEWLPLLLAVGWSLAALRSDRTPASVTLLVVGGGLLSAIEPLVKLSVGPPTVLVCLLGLAGARASRRQWSSYVAITGAGFFFLWFLSGQGLSNLWDYADNGIQVISGYGEAMGIEVAPAWQGVFMAAFAVGLVGVVVARADLRDTRGRWLGAILTGIAAFVVFKYGTTRFHPNTVSLALSAMLAIFLMIPRPQRYVAVFLTAGVVLGAVSLHTYPAPARLDVVANLKRFKESAEVVVRPGLRQGLVNQTRAGLQAAFSLDPKILAAVRGKRVAIDPWEISVAWAYELDWSPLPVFQSYTAYTPQLDRLNAATVEDSSGAQVILRANPGGTEPLGGARSFEGRLPAWDPPEQNFATVCNFAPTVTTDSWQVLSRVPNRCGEPHPIASQRAEPGQTVIVPQAGPGELVLLHLKGAEVEGIAERLRMLVWQPKPRFATLNNGVATYRLVPGTTDDGLIVSRDPALDSTGPFVQLPEIKNISITGVDRPLEFNFYAVKVKGQQR